MENDSESRILVRYHGTDTNDHKLNLKHLGESFVGIYRLCSIGLVLVDTGQLSKPKSKSPIITRVANIRAGSVEIDIIVSITGLGVFKILSDVPISEIHTCVWYWLKGVFYMHSGKKEYTECFIRALDTADHAIDLVEKVEDNRHKEIVQLQHTLKQVIEGDTKATKHLLHATSNPARDSVSPVGNDCDQMQLRNGEEDDEIQIDGELASTIRSRAKTKALEKTEEVTVRVDGFSHSKQQLTVIHPQEPNRSVPAIVDDPSSYLDAAVNNSSLTVKCKTIFRRDGMIDKLYISESRIPDNENPS